MKKSIIVAASILSIAASPSAYAQRFTTTTSPVTYQGDAVDVQKGNGPQLTCTLGITIQQVSAGVYEASNPILTGNGGFCDTVVLVGTPSPPPWSVTSIGSGVWRIHNVYANTTITPGDCFGYIDFTVSTGTPYEFLNIDFGFTNPSTMPQVTANGDCKIRGQIRNPYP